MPGGNKNIKPEDNPKPFTSENCNFTKWTEASVNEVLDKLEAWLWDENEENCFYRDFLYKNKLYESWLTYVRAKFSTISQRMEDIDKIQEHKLQLLAAKGKQRENITKFILSNKYGWSSSEKVDITSGGEKISINFRDE